MTGFGAGSPAIAGAVLLGALLIGVLAGRAKQRFTFLVFGVLGVIGAVIAFNAFVRPPTGDRAAEFTGLYLLGLPLLTAYAAGWLCARGSWFSRLLVVVAAVALVLLFPYAQAGESTAALVGSG
jgi:hypothetical protein